MTPHQINQRTAAGLARVKAYDRRVSAIHEAGHAIIAIHLGYDVDAWIHVNGTDAPIEEKTWLGHVTVINLPAEHDHPHKRMIAVAGMVAETLWKNGHDEEYAEPYGWDDHMLDEESMSYSDWRLADCEPGEPDGSLFDVVAEVAKLFMRGLWADLTEVSRILMSDTESIHRLGPAQERAAA